MLLIYDVRTTRNEIGKSGISFTPFDFERYTQTDGGFMVRLPRVCPTLFSSYRTDVPSR